MDDQRLSKTLSYHLRHAPQEIGLLVQPGGWVEISELLKGLKGKNLQVTIEDLERVTRTSDKQRFAIQGTRMRANQGHSTKVDLELQPQVPPSLLYHGAPLSRVASILKQGLLKGQRHHVHLTLDPDTAIQVGQRRGKPVLLTILALQMHQHGHLFYCSDNGVWLTEWVPPQFVAAPPTSS